MQINLYATLRLAAGSKRVEVPVEKGAQILTVLLNLVEGCPGLRVQLFDQTGQLHNYIHLFVNHKDITCLSDGLQTVVQPNDTLDIFPALAGG